MDGGHEIAVMAVGPGGEAALRPKLVVVPEEAGPDVELEEWVRRSREELWRSLIRPYELDSGPVVLAGRPGWRLLAHHAVEGVGGVTLERLWVLGPGSGWTLSISTPSLDYHTTSGALDLLASGLRLCQQSD